MFHFQSVHEGLIMRYNGDGFVAFMLALAFVVITMVGLMNGGF